MFLPSKKQKQCPKAGSECRRDASSKDIVSLIFYLVSKEYIEIKEKDSIYKLIKRKEYNGKNITESKPMKALFACKNTTTIAELNISPGFYSDCERIIKILEEEKETMFGNQTCSKKYSCNDSMHYWYCCINCFFKARLLF